MSLPFADHASCRVILPPPSSQDPKHYHRPITILAHTHLSIHPYICISYTFFRPYLFVHTRNMRSRRRKKKKQLKPNQTQPLMLCFLPQSLSVKPTSGCSINVLFKEREFPRSVYLQCLCPCGRVAFWHEAHWQLIALKWLFCSLCVCTIARARRLPH